MLSAFWSGLGAEFAKQWSARVLTPAFAFWSAGLALVWWHTNGKSVRAHGWARELEATGTTVNHLPVAEQVLIIVGALVILGGSAFLAERLTLPLLRALEGYWIHPRLLRTWLVDYRRWRYRRYQVRRRDLARRQRLVTLPQAESLSLRALQADPAADPKELRRLRLLQVNGFDARTSADLARARRVLRQMPHDDAMGMPTRLGDVLRAAECRPAEKYGLDAVACWYALWSVLPEAAKREIVEARLALDGAARAWLWGVLFAIWAPWNWWAIAIAAAVATLAYYGGIIGAADLFGELIGTTYDLHRFRLYDALHMPRPKSPQLEREKDGPRVTNLLWGGLDEPGFEYADSPATQEGQTT
jgi:hypothetical protein